MGPVEDMRTRILNPPSRHGISPLEDYKHTQNGQKISFAL